MVRASCTFAAHQIHYQAHFLGRDANVARVSTNIFTGHDYYPFLTFLLSYVAAESAGRCKLTQAVTNHVFRDVNWHMPAAIVHSDGMAYHLREDGAGPAPGANDPFSRHARS
jgi:hypothetical protein